MLVFKYDINLFRPFVFPVGLIFMALSMVGCAATPPPPSPQVRTKLGRIGVLALSSNPRVEFHTYAKGWAAGAAKGGATGAVDGLLSALTELTRNPPTGEFAGLFTLITLAVETTVSATVYGVTGGAKALPAKTTRQIERDLKAAIGNVDLANNLAEKIYTRSISRPDLDRYAVTHLIMPPPGTPFFISDLSKQGINTAVEVQVTEAGLRGGSGTEPNVKFYFNARIRLLATDSGSEIYKRDFQYLSRERPFARWFYDGAKELQSDFRQAMVTLADRIVDELFIVTNFPFASGIRALPGRPEFGSCWFHPIYPELKYTSLWHSIRHNSPGVQIRFSPVDSLKPLLRWESFPRPRDRKPSNASLLGKISDVTYDLKIWETANDHPERLIYDISGLHEPQYRPGLPLKPKKKYFWTFRARYKLADQPQVTRWSFSHVPSYVPSDPPPRKPRNTCELDAVPSSNYFRFTTP